MESASQIDRLPLDDRLAAGGAAPARIVSTPHPGRAKARRLRRKSKKLKLRSHYPPTTLRGYAQARGVSVRKVLWWLRPQWLFAAARRSRSQHHGFVGPLRRSARPHRRLHRSAISARAIADWRDAETVQSATSRPMPAPAAGHSQAERHSRNDAHHARS